jgi:hypothetical protein
MPFEPPNLDQRTFEQLVTEVRRRIPTFTPEWTDLNESDPGITLAQLFAFMTEQLLFQINQVPEKGLITFLKMVGAELHPATPAVADVTFTTVNGATLTDTTFDLDPATRVETAAPPPGEKSPIAFETSVGFTVLNGELVDVLTRDCNLEFTSNKSANESTKQNFAPLDDGKVGDELHLVFDLAPPGAFWPTGSFRVRVNVAGSPDVGEPPPDEFESDVPPRLAWSYSSGTKVNFDGSETVTFTDFEPASDSTDELTRSGYLVFAFDVPTAAAFVRASDSPQLDPEAVRGRFVLRARVLRDDAYTNEGAPRLHSIRLNTVPARAVQTVEDEPLGASSGLPFQRFLLAHAPVVQGSVTIEVDESTEAGGGTQTWVETDDLFANGPTDRVFQLIPATGEVLFGDGKHGKIPPPDDGTVPGGNVVAKSYQFGGGKTGNVGAGTLTAVSTGSPSLPSFTSTNVLSAAGGADEEPTTQGVTRAPAVVRSRFRAVSAEDFEALAKETPDVRVDRAFVLANTRPGQATGAAPGAVTVVLVPFATFESSISTPIGVPAHIAAAVLRFLEGRRLVTTEVFTRAADFRKITADVTLVTEPRASVTDTRTAVIAALNRFFHALVGGADEEGWPFGGTVFFSQVFERILSVPGVQRVEQLLLGLDDGPLIECEDLPLRSGELLFSGVHVVRIGGSA